MAHAEGKITINRPAQAVFDFILDGANNLLWRPSVTDVKAMDDKPFGVGTKFKQGLKGPGGRIDGDYEIVECKPKESIKFKVIAGPARPTGVYGFQSEGNSTILTFILDFQPSGLAKLMGPMIQKSMQEETAMLSNLKTYLESHS